MSVTPDIARTASQPADPARHENTQPFGLIAALAIAIVSILLPVTSTAVLLVGAESARLDVVAGGVRVFKAVLLFHGVLCALLWQVTRLRPAVVPLMAAQPAERASRYTASALAGLIIAGGLLRIVHLGDALWYDEIAALVDQIRQPFGRLLSGFSSQNQHPLYSLLANGSLTLFGESTWALRVPAVLLGIASLGALYAFGTRVTDRREALFATALLAFSYHHVWFSQNARGYSGLLLFALLGTALLADILRRYQWQGWGLYVGYAAVMALGIYTHLTAAFVLVAHALVVGALVTRTRLRSGKMNWPVLVALILAGTLSLQLYALVLPQMPATLFGTRAGLPLAEWKSPLWLLQESIRGLSRGVPGGWIGIAAAALVGGAGLVSYARRNLAVLGLMVLPPVILGTVMVATHHNLWPRFFFFAGGFAVLIGVRGVFSLATIMSRTRGPRLATLALGVVTLGSAALVGRAWGPKQDFSGARSFVDEQLQAGDAVVIAGMTRLPYERYLQTGWQPVENARQLQGIEASHGRTWLVYTVPEHLRVFAPEVLQRVESSYRLVRAFPGTLGGGTVYVMVNR